METAGIFHECDCTVLAIAPLGCLAAGIHHLRTETQKHDIIQDWESDSFGQCKGYFEMELLAGGPSADLSVMEKAIPHKDSAGLCLFSSSKTVL